MSDSQFEFTDRYQALGIPYPDPATVCAGQCEGTGWVPVSEGESVSGDLRLAALWQAEHAKAHTLRGRLHAIRVCGFMRWYRRIAILWERCDGWHFVKCPDCGGTGVTLTPEQTR